MKPPPAMKPPPPEADRLFLTLPEAIEAIRIDFESYPPQRPLFMGLVPLILGPAAMVTPDRAGPDAWLYSPDDGPARRLCPADLGQALIAALARRPPQPPELARICARVFQSRATAAERGRKPGIWIETGMAGFRCRRCGRCCRRLDYHDQLTEVDYQRFVAAGRRDVLRRVGRFERGGRAPRYTIWVDPATGAPETVCPWLRKAPDSEKRLCAIHDIKPGVCRQYPTTRKHAEMTGCRGFDTAGD